MGFVRVSDHAGVAVVVIDRPPANALDVGLLEEIVATVADLRSAQPAAVVLAGRQGCFSAGADLKAVPDYGPDERRAAVAGINAMALGVYGLPCPVVGAITGHAIAGGFVLALCTDLRVAASTGRYGLTEVKVGVPYPQAAIGVVQAELAPHAARQLALGNELVDAEECRRIGAFDEVLAPVDVPPRALVLAKGLAELPADVYARTKDALRGPTIARLTAAAASDPLLDGGVG